MRKKSHISLAKYIVGRVEEQGLVKHKKAFYLGSILPDCKPSFFTEKHEMEGTFPKLQEELRELVEGQQKESANERAFYRNLGEVLHYIADYFTFPHNAHYTGGFKDHCIYEKHLKKGLREYLRSGEAERYWEAFQDFMPCLGSIEAVCDYIQSNHEAYVKLENTVEGDCRQIVILCQKVAEAVILLAREEEVLQAA